MAPQSARRDRKNQCFPPCYPSTLVGDLDPVRELPYGLAALIILPHQKPDRWQHPTRCQTNRKIACVPGGVHRWKADIRTRQRPRKLGNLARVSEQGKWPKFGPLRDTELVWTPPPNDLPLTYAGLRFR